MVDILARSNDTVSGLSNVLGVRMILTVLRALLIVVTVTMDTVTQIQSHLLAHQYGDLIKKAKLKGDMHKAGATMGKAPRKKY